MTDDEIQKIKERCENNLFDPPWTIEIPLDPEPREKLK